MADPSQEPTMAIEPTDPESVGTEATDPVALLEVLVDRVSDR